ncbi:MAG: acriflavin resistance protein [Gammaproteobacteria bacterium 28-57-27]|nr:MAG: acriflavin resistance protein [Gammaproteobacteria bacterium 28-57-27]
MNSMLAFFIRHRVAANVLVLVALIAGFMGMTRMNVQFFPNFALDVLSVRVLWSGASAEDVENGIVIPLEERLKTVDGVKKLSSTAAQGVASITLELKEGTDSLASLDQVRQRVAEFSNLPKDAEAPQISRVTRYEPVARLLVRGPSLSELRPWVRQFERELLQQGIDRIDIQGLPDERIAIEIPAAQLESLNLSLADAGDRVAKLARDLPSGIAGQHDGAREVRSLEQRRDAEGFANLPLISDEKGVVRLGDVAVITREARPANLALQLQGEPVVELILQRTENGNALKAAKVLETWLDATRPTLPPSLQLEVYDQQWELVRDRINLLLNNGLSGLLIVALILYLFLPGRVALWVALGVPTAFLLTLGLLMLFGGSINMLSLFALIMALGIIVDDAIVVGEDAATHRAMGESPENAAIGGAQRMVWPVVASSLTTVAAFLPLLMVGGVFGKIMFDIPFVMIMVIMASLLECFLILPAHLRSAFVAEARRPVSKLRQRLDNAFEHFREQRFRPLVTKAIEYRYTTVSLTLALMLLAVGLLVGGRIPFVFFPSPESSVIYANATFVAGTPRTQTEAFLKTLEHSLTQTEQAFGEPLIKTAVSRMNATIGSSGSGASGEQLASIMLELVPSEQRTTRNEAIIAKWRELTPPVAGLENLSISSRQSGPPSRDLTVRLTGNHADSLKDAALSLQETLHGISGVSDVADDLPYGREQLIYRLTPMGEALGLTTESLSRQLRAAFDGNLVQRVQVGQDELEVRVLLPHSERERLDILERLSIRLSSGEFVPLPSVVNWESRRGFEALRHAQGQLAVEVTADVDKSLNNSRSILQELQKQALPALAERYGIAYSLEGSSADQRETMQDMKTGLMIGLLLIYLILVWILGSWSWPLVVMTAIPLGLTGAIFGHWIMGIDLTLLSMFGLFGLAGIVVNNAIILVSLFSELHAKGLGLHEAFVEAASGRLRAVILTSLTTIGGLTPLMFESSLQAQFLIPMAVSIVFGLAFSALLVLFFIPALLSILEGFKERFKPHTEPHQSAVEGT